MAVQAYPIPIADFWDKLRMPAMSFRLSQSMRWSETGGGEILTSGLGTRLWEGEVSGVPAHLADQRKFEAMLESLQAPGRSFFAYDVAQPYPDGDPGGATISGATPRISALPSDTRQIAIDGLPANYSLPSGTMLSFQYGTNPLVFALHRVRSDVVANGSGVTPQFEVNPAIRPGATLDTVVRLTKPICKAIMVPGSLEIGMRRPVIAEGFSFRWRQSLR